MPLTRHLSMENLINYFFLQLCTQAFVILCIVLFLETYFVIIIIIFFFFGGGGL